MISEKSKVLQSKNLFLKAISDTDKESLISICKNEKVNVTYMLPVLDSKEKEDVLFEKIKESTLSGKLFCYGIYLGETLIGWLNDCGNDGNEIEIGYVIDPAYQGHGYATEAFGKAIDELFRIGYKRVTAGYFEGNDASRRVMEKCGLHPNGIEEYIAYRGVKHKCFYMETEYK